MHKRVIIATLLVINVTPTSAHCYTHWYYPWPQNCRGIYTRQSYRPPIISRANFSPPVHNDSLDIPLPDMSGIWINTVETPEQLELMESLQRLKALKSLQNN
jgi:hypothetical protein